MLGPALAAFECLRQSTAIALAQLAATDQAKRLKAAVDQGADLAATAQSVTDFILAARARKQLAEIGVADGHILAQEAKVLADRARRCGFGFGRGIAADCPEAA